MIDIPPSHPLHKFQLFHGGRPDALREALFNALGAREIEIDGDLRDFQAASAYLRLKHLELIYSNTSTMLRLKLPEIKMVKQQFVLCGSGRTRFGATQFDVGPEETGIIPAGVDMLHHNGAGLAQFVFRAATDALQTKLSAIAGMAVVKDIEFETQANLASPQLQRLRRLLGFIVAELDRDDGAVPPQALDEYEQMLLVSFLTANRHNFTHLLERPPRPAAPWQVRLVEEYIEANWNKPITIEALAAVTGGSARSIFKSFKETRGATPMAFVKAVRLEHARRLLQAPDETASVIGIAFACAFMNSGHCARDYRLAFGELPSATLAKARRCRS
jgi:AraC-like DNA-binding protein